MEEFLFIDKPSGPTSHDIVDAVRRQKKTRRVGHAGTLDPFASGLLILGVGKATKRLGEFVGLDKEYEAVLQLGATSDTYDRTGKISKSANSQIYKLDDKTIRNALKKFTGPIEQIPPMYSAKKVKGKKLYELARQGIEIPRKPIKVKIYELDLLEMNRERQRIKLRVKCSSGTYIRALANDLGQELGTGAYLLELRRTAIGPYRVETASNVPTLGPDPRCATTTTTPGAWGLC